MPRLEELVDPSKLADLWGALGDEDAEYKAFEVEHSEFDPEVKVRKVRTAEGARVYGQPIGTPITKDMIDAAKQKVGKAPDLDGDGKPAAGKPAAAAAAPKKKPGVAEVADGGDPAAGGGADDLIVAGSAEKRQGAEKLEAAGVPEQAFKAIEPIKVEGRPDGAGTVEDPIDVGEDLDQAVRLIGEGKHVRLRHSVEVGVVLDKIKAAVEDAKSKGENAPDYNLCAISVPDTNLFCIESKGIPRVEMPQLSGIPEKGSPAEKLMKPEDKEANITAQFRAALEARGIKVQQKTVKAVSLRASQDELDGPKVAGMTRAMEAGKIPDAPIFVTRDGYVIDGHHRWAAKVSIDSLDGKLGDIEMPVDEVDMDIGAALDFANAFAAEMGIKPKGLGAAAEGVAGKKSLGENVRRALAVRAVEAAVLAYEEKAGPKRVRSAEGSRRFGQPVGAIIDIDKPFKAPAAYHERSLLTGQELGDPSPPSAAEADLYVDDDNIVRQRAPKERSLLTGQELPAPSPPSEAEKDLYVDDDGYVRRRRKSLDSEELGMEVKGREQQSGLEHKNDGATAVIEADDETGVVTAIVSVTGVEDRVQDIIEPGAYDETLTLRDPIGVWSHDDKVWVARPEEVKELLPGDAYFQTPEFKDAMKRAKKEWPAEAGALLVKARFNLETPHGAAAFSDVKFFEGRAGWSIGYKAKQAKRDPRTGVRRIKSLDLYEFSPVMVGAAAEAMTLSVKSLFDGEHDVPDTLTADEVKAIDDARTLLDEIEASVVAEPENVEDDEDENIDDLLAQHKSLIDDLIEHADLDDTEEKAGPKRVRSAEGARKFGQSIGSVIKPDVPTAQVGHSGTSWRDSGDEDAVFEGMTEESEAGYQRWWINKYGGLDKPTTRPDYLRADEDFEPAYYKAPDIGERHSRKRAEAVMGHMANLSMGWQDYRKGRDPVELAPGSTYEGVKIHKVGNVGGSGKSQWYLLLGEVNGKFAAYDVLVEGGDIAEFKVTAYNTDPRGKRPRKARSAASMKSWWDDAVDREREEGFELKDVHTGSGPSQSTRGFGKTAFGGGDSGPVITGPTLENACKSCGSKSKRVKHGVHVCAMCDTKWHRDDDEKSALLDEISELRARLEALESKAVTEPVVEDTTPRIDATEPDILLSAVDEEPEVIDLIGDYEFPDDTEVKKGGDLDRSPKKNWVEASGGLPAYIERIAKALHREQGMTISRAIATAIAAVKRWAVGAGEVNADTRAKAAKAVAQWEALRAKNKARKAVKDVGVDLEWFDGLPDEEKAILLDGEWDLDEKGLLKRVRTAEGAREFGQPIGSVITDDHGGVRQHGMTHVGTGGAAGRAEAAASRDRHDPAKIADRIAAGMSSRSGGAISEKALRDDIARISGESATDEMLSRVARKLKRHGITVENKSWAWDDDDDMEVLAPSELLSHKALADLLD